MKLTIGIPVLNQHELTVNFLKLLQENTNIIDEIIIVDNGSTPEIATAFLNLDSRIINNLKIIRHQENIGVRPALNEIWKEASGDIIVYTHNDVEFLESGWDDKIRKAFETHKEAGIVGVYGAKGLGTSDIYQTFYQMVQLARFGNVSNALMDQQMHGFRNLRNEFENVSVFDGFFMAIKKELLDKTQGFSDILPSHHNYDNLISIQSIQNGYENIVIPLGVNHLGGRTDVGEDWTKGTGKTKQEVHADAHPPLYEYGRGFLPVMIEDIYDPSGTRIIGYTLYNDRKLIKTKIYD